MRTSTDFGDPNLRDAVESRRALFGDVVDSAWREERLLRYHYWLTHERTHPDFNIVVSWTTADLGRELALWNALDPDDDSERVLEQLRASIQLAYGASVAEATAICSNAELARHGMAIWNERASALIPGSLGHLALSWSTDYESQRSGGGWGYSYRTEDASEWLDLYLYDRNLGQIRSGIGSQQVLDELHRSFQEAMAVAHKQGHDVADVDGPLVVTLRSRYSVPYQFLIATWESKDKEQRSCSSVSMTGFRGLFLKTRYTAMRGVVEREGYVERIDGMNKGLVDLCTFFGPLADGELVEPNRGVSEMSGRG